MHTACGDGWRLHGASLMVPWAATGDTRSWWGEIAKGIPGCWSVPEQPQGSCALPRRLCRDEGGPAMGRDGNTALPRGSGTTQGVPPMVARCRAVLELLQGQALKWHCPPQRAGGEAVRPKPPLLPRTSSAFFTWEKSRC